MRKVSKKMWEAAETAALQGFKALSEAMTYQGNNAKYDKNAKHGAVAVGGYTKMLASQNNTANIVLTATRLGNKETVLGLISDGHEES